MSTIILPPPTPSLTGVEATRHLDVFSPTDFGNRKVSVIGCGATGSRIALSLAKLGVKNLVCHDFDTVESHNIANQAFYPSHTGMKKVEALRQLIAKQALSEVNVSDQEVIGPEISSEVVFLLTDTMSSRKAIWSHVKYKPHTSLIVETRMGADSCRVYAINPCDPNHIDQYEKTLYEDQEVAEESACGASVSVGPTAEIVSGLAVWQMVRWFGVTSGRTPNDQLDQEIILSLRPPMMLNRKF